ncbi:hypothetical protein ACH4ZX_26565 [Streptomyces sp. NPDC020490]|uniref:hypothetical protein n=1 Tax=Streptomyces sp. NPDC020490 TaxID=3365078 RepID=UPI0037905061
MSTLPLASVPEDAAAPETAGARPAFPADEPEPADEPADEPAGRPAPLLTAAHRLPEGRLPEGRLLVESLVVGERRITEPVDTPRTPPAAPAAPAAAADPRAPRVLFEEHAAADDGRVPPLLDEAAEVSLAQPLTHPGRRPAQDPCGHRRRAGTARPPAGDRRARGGPVRRTARPAPRDRVRCTGRRDREARPGAGGTVRPGAAGGPDRAARPGSPRGRAPAARPDDRRVALGRR